MYKFELSTKERIFLITLSGFLSKEEGSSYICDLSEKLKTFNTKEYYAVVDTQDLKAGGQDSLEGMKTAVEMLVKTPFKGYFNIIPKSVTTKMQAKRVVKDEIFNKLKPITLYNEIPRLINC